MSDTTTERKAVLLRFSTNPKIAKQQQAIVEKAKSVKGFESMNEFLLQIIIDKCEDITGLKVKV